MKVKDVKIGKLRHRLAIQRRDRTADGGGGFDPPAWVNVTTVWGEVKPMSMREQFHTMKLETPVTHTVVIRYRPDVTAVNGDWRILHETRQMNIRGVINIEEMDVYLQLLVDEGLAQ